MSILYFALEQSLLFLPLILGIYISYHILKVTDLSVDGTYVLGAAVFARTIYLGIIPALILSILGGIIIGLLISYMQRHDVVSDIVVGVLAGFMLYSINLQILGRPNVSTLGKSNLLSWTQCSEWITLLTIIAIVAVFSIGVLLNSEFGLKLRAFGHNQSLLKILGKSPEYYRACGLIISSVLSAITGAFAAQINGFADINMGFGIALIGISAIIIGRHLIIHNHHEKFIVLREVLACFIGIYLYFICLSSVLAIGVNPTNLKLILGLILFIALRKIRRREATSEQ